MLIYAPNHLCTYVLQNKLLWPPYEIGQTIIFLPCGFFLSSVYLFFFPRLILAAAHWMSIILYTMVWP